MLKVLSHMKMQKHSIACLKIQIIRSLCQNTFGASDFWAVIQEAKDISADYETFQDMFERVAKVEIINDLELLARLKAIYNKYVIE